MTDSNDHSVSTWIQIAATVSVVIGLGLVVIELQQAKALSRASLGSQHMTEVLENQRTVMGENPSRSLIRACLHPGQLTEEDLMILASHFAAQAILAERIRGIEAIVGFGSPWKLVASTVFENLASTRPGRAWLASRTIHPDLEELRSAALENFDGTECATNLGILRDSVAPG